MRFKSERNRLARLLSTFAVLIFCTCAERKAVDLVNPNFNANVPRTVAVLPMDNLSKDLDATPLVRPIVQQRLIYKGYDCMPIDRVDALLKTEKGMANSHDVYSFSPQELGEILGVDAVVYGTVTDFDKRFAIVYSDIVVGVKLEMTSTWTGESLWSSEHVASQNTAVPSLFLAAAAGPYRWEDALTAVTVYNAAFTLLSQYRPYAEDVLREAMIGLPPGPLGMRPYPWDLDQRSWDGDLVVVFVNWVPLIPVYSPRLPGHGYDHPGGPDHGHGGPYPHQGNPPGIIQDHAGAGHQDHGQPGILNGRGSHHNP